MRTSSLINAAVIPIKLPDENETFETSELSTAEVNHKARSLGLSYGQYVYAVSNGSIWQHINQLRRRLNFEQMQRVRRGIQVD